MSKSNYPNSQVDSLPAEFVVDTIGSIQELAAGKKITRDPAMDLEFESRVQQIIEFCKSRGMRIGIETLCAGLGTTRQEYANKKQKRSNEGKTQHEKERKTIGTVRWGSIDSPVYYGGRYDGLVP